MKEIEILRQEKASLKVKMSTKISDLEQENFILKDFRENNLKLNEAFAQMEVRNKVCCVQVCEDF